MHIPFLCIFYFYIIIVLQPNSQKSIIEWQVLVKIAYGCLTCAILNILMHSCRLYV